MADQFFAKAPSAFKEYNISEDQISALEACINGDLELEAATRRLTAHPAASPTPLEMQQRLGGLWTLLNNTAVGIPSAQPQIISVLKKIQTLPNVEEPKGEGAEFIDLDNGFFWRELTGWANNWADSYNCEERAARKEAWTSANAYTARLASTGNVELSSHGAALERASYTIIKTLEASKGDKEPEELEAAAQLFMHAALELHRLCREKHTTGGRYGLWRTGVAGRPRENELWHGPPGPSVERWRFWMERWAAFASVQSFSPHARAAALGALEAMKKAEGQGTQILTE
ncbi:hypothetical protein G7Z17_g37 [Cylindrodendrum hubeiense]|uniref:Uncharacterized protein n=1 Tax=Cylindrodendrum hubeiense TaxID=595255 RepID=A0A9P5HLQ9_9HYPO|nr:hypothetical protein G7Z17_g37 [Cylindrodendrum hubeiense]